MSRRRFLAAAGAAAASAALPTSVRAAVPDGTNQGGLEQVEHVIILMQENRSFDSYFGTLAGVRGFDDPNAIKLPGGKSVFHQPLTLGKLGLPAEVLPYRLNTFDTSGACAFFGSQAWQVSHQALADGRMNGWIGANFPLLSIPQVMGYFTRDDMPFYYALADAFTICDMYFCSVLGPTNPNRLYAWTGTIDPEGHHGGPVIDNSEKPDYRWTTYPERLERAGITWRVYQQEDNFDDNPLAWFTQFKQAPPSSSLYRNGMQRRPFTAFADDVKNDALPQVSWLIAPTPESEHPNNPPGAGAALTRRYLQALAANPKVWRKSVLFLNYDEHGGAFDHVRPPTPPPGTLSEFVGAEPIGLGFRVPMIVISPWTRGGFVSSQVFDHTSVLRFLEARFGVEEPNISDWRRRTCGDLTSVFDFKRPNFNWPLLPSTDAEAARDAACRTRLPALPLLGFQDAPHQEKGKRRQRPF